VTTLLLIIDSKREVRCGVAPHFPPVSLGKGDAMMNQELFDYLDVKVGDPIEVDIELGSFVGSNMK
jgi:hypothetical protein